jgi:hypothetical protein
MDEVRDVSDDVSNVSSGFTKTLLFNNLCK